MIQSYQPEIEMHNETASQVVLRREKEAIAIYQDQENEARKKLAEAMESTKRARANYEKLFLEEERKEVARRKNSYGHATK